jgi:starch synthase (maltosyl-transferring)
MAEKPRAQVRKRPGAPADESQSTGAPAADLPALAEGRCRVVVDAVFPVLDGGRFPVKRIAGEPVAVEAHCFTDGHDTVRAVLAWQADGSPDRDEIEMQALVNDVWTAQFTPPSPGRYRFTVTAWVDHFETWRRELMRRDDLGDIKVALEVGAGLIELAAQRAATDDAAALGAWAALLRKSSADGSGHADAEALKGVALDPARAAVVARHPDRRFASSTTLELVADRKRAQFSAWYELFPRSTAVDAARHGTFRDVEARLPYVAQLGFDVLYLPPIHPIGKINRKGPNNALTAAAADVGSPWAIGSSEGGHKDILPQLGTLDARPITLTSRRTRSGSSTGRTAAFSTRKIPRKNIRTSTRSISRPTIGGHCGPSSRA